MWENKPTTEYYLTNHQKEKKKKNWCKNTTEKCLGVSEGKFGD